MEEEVKDIGFPIGDIDQVQMGVFFLEPSGLIQTVEPLLTFFFGDGTIFTCLFFPKRFAGSFPDLMMGKA